MRPYFLHHVLRVRLPSAMSIVLLLFNYENETLHFAMRLRWWRAWDYGCSRPSGSQTHREICFILFNNWIGFPVAHDRRQYNDGYQQTHQSIESPGQYQSGLAHFIRYPERASPIRATGNPIRASLCFFWKRNRPASMRFYFIVWPMKIWLQFKWNTIRIPHPYVWLCLCACGA